MDLTNSIEFSSGEGKSLLITGHDDKKVRVWDYDRGVCIARLEGHKDWVYSVFFHPHLPYIFSASDSGEVRVWRQSNYELVSSFPLGVQRLWSMAPCKDSNKLVLGADGQFQVLEVNIRENRIPSQELIQNKEKKVEELESEVVRIKLELTRKKEEEVEELRLKHKEELDEVRADHREKERTQANWVKQLEDEVRALKSNNTSMTERLAMAERRNQELESEMKFKFKKELDEVTEDLREKERMQANRAKQLEDEVKTLKAWSRVMTQRLGKAMQANRAKQLEDEVRALKSKNTSMAERLAMAERRNQELESEMEFKFKKELDEVTEDLREKERMQANRAKQLEDEVKTLKTWSKVMAQRLAKAKDRNAELKSERAELVEKVQHLHSEVKNLIVQKAAVLQNL
ncbi:hypothetical protein CBR_g51645 [Chara braunii]|uniref:Uncharacterized protein n=1 Tax=Chara braunii TaxID=69332 RepID=A0A388M8S5_CHABU|nr:hypothetical protein CBR_g51645 [Chara braunii]|eukprot:GBG90987.1 hypothetical protein CBR_g51645 [Chara braunii]